MTDDVWSSRLLLAFVSRAKTQLPSIIPPPSNNKNLRNKPDNQRSRSISPLSSLVLKDPLTRLSYCPFESWSLNKRLSTYTLALSAECCSAALGDLGRKARTRAECGKSGTRTSTGGEPRGVHEAEAWIKMVHYWGDMLLPCAGDDKCVSFHDVM